MVEVGARVRVVVVVEDEEPAAADRVVIVGFTGSRLGEVVLAASLRVVGPSFLPNSWPPVAGLRKERVRLKLLVDDIVMGRVGKQRASFSHGIV